MAATRQRSSVGDAGAASVGSSSRRPASRPGGRRGPPRPRQASRPYHAVAHPLLARPRRARFSLLPQKFAHSHTPRLSLASHLLLFAAPRTIRQSHHPQRAPRACVPPRSAERSLARPPLVPLHKIFATAAPGGRASPCAIALPLLVPSEPRPANRQGPRHIPPPLRQTPARHTRSHGDGGGGGRRREGVGRGQRGGGRRCGSRWG
jgi:hypothetical protein